MCPNCKILKTADMLSYGIRKGHLPVCLFKQVLNVSFIDQEATTLCLIFNLDCVRMFMWNSRNNSIYARHSRAWHICSANTVNMVSGIVKKPMNVHLWSQKYVPILCNIRVRLTKEYSATAQWADNVCSTNQTLLNCRKTKHKTF